MISMKLSHGRHDATHGCPGGCLGHHRVIGDEKKIAHRNVQPTSGALLIAKTCSSALAHDTSANSDIRFRYIRLEHAGRCPFCVNS